MNSASMSKISQIPKDINLADVLNYIISTLEPQDPLEYIDKMYNSVNPAFIDFAVEVGKKKVSELNNKKGTKEANIYFTLGHENATKSKISGFFSGILWLEDYVHTKGETYGVSKQEMKTFTDVLRKMGLPQIVDAFVPEDQSYSVKTYSACLSHYLMWLSRGSLANKSGAEVTRSNGEVCELITSSSLSSYPAVPFTAYYLGTIKTNEDILSLAEKMYKDVKFDKFITEEFSFVNEPQFVVTTSNSPITNMVGHPLGVMTYGLTDSNTRQQVNWFAGYSGTREFDQLCLANNTTSKDVAKYIISTSLEKHKKNIEMGDPIAKFINSQKIANEIFERLRKSDGLLKYDQNPNYM